MSYEQDLDRAGDDLINNLETRKVRALACQCKLENWNTEGIAKLRRQLIELSKTVDVLQGLPA